MRTELRALTPETLAELTNRGLVKRAVREIERSMPVVVEDGEATVHATYDDGVTTALPAGGLDQGRCSCGAPGVCRHIVGLVLAYQRVAEHPEPGHPDPHPPDHPAPGHDDASAPGPGHRNAGLADPESADSGHPSSGRRNHGDPGRAGDSKPSLALAGDSGPSDAAGPTAGADGDTSVAESGEAAAGGNSRIEWSPGDFTDDQLVERIGVRRVAAARRVKRAGYIARVHRARPGDPVSSVELPTATVRFLVPRDLGFARTDAVAGVRDDVLALAVWAFQEADARFPGDVDVQVQVGGSGATAGGPGLDAAVALASVVLREGAVHVGAGIAADIGAVRRTLEAGRMRWPLLAVDDLVTQLEAYRDRSARYRPEALADHVAELFARHRAVTSTDAEPPTTLSPSPSVSPSPSPSVSPSPRTGPSLSTGPARDSSPGPSAGSQDQRALRSRVLGTDEASETPLRRARLDGLGARVSVVGTERMVEVFLAHADSATVLVLRRSYETGDAGPLLAGRRVAGVSIGALAAGAVVTESAARSASRAVRLGTRRLSRTEAMASRGSWQDLPRALIAGDLAALADELAALPPRPVRARVEAELVRVVPVAEVRSVSYAPGAQRLDAVIADAAGVTAVVSASHAACAPGRLDSMAVALRGELRYVAGSVRRAGGGVVIDPIGFALADSVVVPDLAPAGRGTDPDDAPVLSTDPLGLALDEAAALLAELAHGGLQHAPATVPGRLRTASGRLRGVGLRRVGEAVEALAGRLGPDPGDDAAEAWVDAYLRVNLAADMR